MKYICVYGASSNAIDEKYLSETGRLGELMASRGFGLVYGGGANGVMGAVARGVRRGGGHIIGIAPSFFDTEGILYKECDEFIYPETMRERKMLFEQRSDAIISDPGGIGTFDEFFEIITRKQLGLTNKAIVLLNLFGYYDPLIAAVNNAVKQSFALSDTLGIFEVCGTGEEALDYIAAYIPPALDTESAVKARALKKQY